MKVQIYHNPRCSKSRQTLELIRSKGIEPKIHLYLENAPSENELEGIVGKLGISVFDLVRRKEELFKELGLESANEKILFRALAAHPRLIERPIVVVGDKAVLGRPPENVNELL